MDSNLAEIKFLNNGEWIYQIFKILKENLINDEIIKEIKEYQEEVLERKGKELRAYKLENPIKPFIDGIYFDFSKNGIYLDNRKCNSSIIFMDYNRILISIISIFPFSHDNESILIEIEEDQHIFLSFQNIIEIEKFLKPTKKELKSNIIFNFLGNNLLKINKSGKEKLIELKDSKSKSLSMENFGQLISIDYDAELEITNNMLKTIFNEIELFSDKILFYAFYGTNRSKKFSLIQEEEIKHKAKRLFNSISVIFKNNIEIKESCKSYYPIHYVKFLKSFLPLIFQENAFIHSNKDPTFKNLHDASVSFFHLKDDQPLRFDFKSDLLGSKLFVFIAPYIENEEEEDNEENLSLIRFF